MNRSHYKIAICLSIVLAVAMPITWGFFAFLSNEQDNGFIWVMIVSSIILPFGLWVGSNLVRYVGGAMLVLCAGGLIWPLFSVASDPDRLAPRLSFGLLGGLCLWAAWLLLFSGKFRSEFAEVREVHSKYNMYLRRAMIYIAIVTFLFVTLYDVYRFMVV